MVRVRAQVPNADYVALAHIATQAFTPSSSSLRTVACSRVIIN